ncbi:MAG: LLM class flavin-dependent oxidoreductase [Candidatus Tectomicrobia bacterium]|uniref:LLM class flavin-dependent oxidoreductase n=1 Tax=Tectimicrobiota bacterium TaxID=2528274 RepID=A0A937VY74_UNCTE|nr:LLM class flavin-dependent oxidoreductase [Candidatus Tectomicrobia bacterium]
MKVRFGFTCRGQADLALDDFPHLVDDLERLGFDSLWLPEHMLNGPFDPLVSLAHAAARTTRLKLGAYLIVPGRNPVRLARELANLDRLSAGRLLLIMVLGQPSEAELLAQHVAKNDRGALLEEVLPLLRRLWSGEVVNHAGPCYPLHEARLAPTPVQTPLEMWLGGQVPSALRRAGRLGDGWIPGLLTPTEAAEKRQRVEAAAAEAGRCIDPEHFGVNLTYSRGPLSPTVLEPLRRRRPDLDPVALVPQSRAALHERVDAWLAVGFSKFLLRPAIPPANWTAELEMLAEDILEHQT